MKGDKLTKPIENRKSPLHTLNRRFQLLFFIFYFYYIFSLFSLWSVFDNFLVGSFFLSGKSNSSSGLLHCEEKNEFDTFFLPSLPPLPDLGPPVLLLAAQPPLTRRFEPPLQGNID